MLIAIQNGPNSFNVGDLRTLFPDTLFPVDGPNQDWFKENNVLMVNMDIPHDPSTQYLESCLPYLKDGSVYVYRVVELPDQGLQDA
jgi:hypothetical protein